MRLTEFSYVTLQSFLRYILSGLVALGTHLLVLTALIELYAVNEVISSAIGFLVACVVNFLIQSNYVFAMPDNKSRRFVRYTSVTLATFVLNNLCFYFLLEFSSLHYSVIQLMTTAFIFLLNYALNAVWTFSPSKFDPRESQR